MIIKRKLIEQFPVTDEGRKLIEGWIERNAPKSEISDEFGYYLWFEKGIMHILDNHDDLWFFFRNYNEEYMEFECELNHINRENFEKEIKNQEGEYDETIYFC